MALPEEVGLRKEVQVNRLQCVAPQAREAPPAYLQRAEAAVREANPEAGELVAEKADVEWGVVGHEDAVPDEPSKKGQGLLRRRLAFEHLVGDAVDRLHGVGDGDAGVDQRRKLLNDDALFHGNRADLDYTVAVTGRKAGGFDINHHLTLCCSGCTRDFDHPLLTPPL